jgi:hypothetical protein
VWQHPVLRSREDDIDDPCRRGPSQGSALALVQGAAALLELPLPDEDATLIADLLFRLQVRTASIVQQDAEPSGPESPGAPW